MTRTPLTGKPVLALAVLLALLVLASGLGGLLSGSLYARETESWTAQAIAQDMFDIALLVPVLLTAVYFVRRGSRPALFALQGSLIYSAYTFVIYCFACHFNALFLVYCGALGLSLYALAFMLSGLNPEELKGWFDPQRSVSMHSAFLIAVALVFCFLWLSEDLPAVIHNQVPKTIVDAGLMTNPVHVLDLAILIPGAAVCALILRKRRPLGYLFGTSLFVFLAMMSLTIAWIVVYENFRGISSDPVLPSLFGALCIVNCALFAGITGNMRKEPV